MQNIRDWEEVDRAVFENEVLPANQPAVLRGLLRDWPVVQAGRQSDTSLVDYLKRIDSGSAVTAMIGPPEIRGRLFYSDDFKGFNFGSKAVPLGTALDTYLSLAEDPEPPAITLQALHVPDVLPSFVEDNPLPLLDGNVVPRIWISNRSIIAPHFDNNRNIACVVGGRRRFTVFPPEQISNLYIGPLLKTPGGTPISTVDLRDPDFTRFPRFREALESAQQAVLEPGDAIYIPILWWHGVESLEPLNVLVNYWWNDTLPANHKPILALIHSAALISALPDDERETWRRFFDHFVFQADGDPGAHLPADLRDLPGKLSAADRNEVLAFVAERLKTLLG
ncbi:MAG: cupin-like domain-containing protein [Woeseiaceae bacterium]|nr:cupin-like domain-containing protein [Woeseiaceae bacterium]